MLIGERIRAIREAKGLSQGDIEKRSGLRRFHISRAENGYSVPSVETLEKIAYALEVPLYQFFYQGKERPDLPVVLKQTLGHQSTWGGTHKQIRFWEKLHHLLALMSESDQRLLLHLAQKMAGNAQVNKHEGDPRWALVDLSLWTAVVLIVVGQVVYLVAVGFSGFGESRIGVAGSIFGCNR